MCPNTQQTAEPVAAVQPCLSLDRRTWPATTTITSPNSSPFFLTPKPHHPQLLLFLLRHFHHLLHHLGHQQPRHLPLLRCSFQWVIVSFSEAPFDNSKNSILKYSCTQPSISSLPSNYDHLATTIMYGKDTLELEDVRQMLKNNELMKKTDSTEEASRLFVKGQRGRSKSRGPKRDPRGDMARRICGLFNPTDFRLPGI